MQITRSKLQDLPTKILIVVGVLVWVCMASDAIAAWYPATYAESAHGDLFSGVNRSTATCQNWPDETCVIGSCAHCHDTFDPDICVNDVNGLMMFAPNNPDSQTDNFCFQCHKSDGAAQQVTNYTYSKNFGGGNITFTTIYDAFNPGTEPPASSHNLKDIQDWMTDKVGFTSDSNPCVVCHNPHTAQDNHPVSLSGRGGVNTAIRKALDYQDRNSNLWGDEDFATSGYWERMKDLADGNSISYKAPYYKGGTNYEPANNAIISDGSNLPNFVMLCWDCHRYDVISSTEHGTLEPVSWTTYESEPGDQNVHGLWSNSLDPDLDPEYTRLTAGGHLKDPYDDNTNYVLSCTDCHEPHGSPNEWLLRTSVNGKDDISITPLSGYWYEFCTACHVVYVKLGDPPFSKHEQYSGACPGCHGHVENPGLF